MSGAHTAIAVATSIPPRLARQNEGKRIDEEYQRLCISSWISSGFRVLSVNDRDEIPDLASRYPDVEFIVTERNASAWTGRKNPYIADLLHALQDAPEHVVGIINSDLIFEASTTWEKHLPAMVEQAVVIGHRYDATSLLKGVLRRFWPGFDHFFFDKATARMLGQDALPFAMGLPFWDYWLPIAAAVNGREVRVLERPSVVHLMHAHGYQHTALGDFARIFANFVVKCSEDATRPLPQCVREILPICRAIVALPIPTDNDRVMEKVTEVIMAFPPLIRNDVISVEPDPFPSSGNGLRDQADANGQIGIDTHDVFARFDRRRAGGEAFEQAKGFVLQGKPAAAEEKFRAAATDVPDDFEVLLSFGEFLFSRGNAPEACQFLRKAVERDPTSSRSLNSLGVALNARGNRADAIACFKEVLRIDPKFKDAYLNLAIVLFETGHPREALDHLTYALKEWPDFREAAQFHARFSSIFRA